MALAFDASSSTDGTLVSSLTYAHTCAGTDRILLVVVGGSDSTTTDRVVQGITYNSVALSKIRADDNDPDNIFTELWYLLNPDTGAHNIVVTMNGGNVTSLASGGMSFTGAHQSAPEANNGAIATGTAEATVNVVTVTDNAWIIGGVFTTESGASDILPGSGVVQRFEEDLTSDNLVGGSKPVTPAGSSAFNFTWTGNENWAISACSVKPADASGPTPTFISKFLSMGVGA